MLTLEYFFKFGCYLIWIVNEDGGVVDTVLPPEISNDTRMEQLFSDLQYTFDHLYINTSHEFSFVGFRTNEEKQEIERKANEGLKLLQ